MRYFLLIFLFAGSLARIAVAQKNTDPYAKGIEYYNNKDIKDAVYYFYNFIKDDSTNAYALYWLGKCYENTAERDKALTYFLKAYGFNKEVAPDILYRLGHAYHLNLMFEDAVKYYKLHKSKMTDEKATKMGSSVINESIKVAKRLQECENGKLIVAHRYNHKIINIGAPINSEYGEYAPAVTEDGQTLIFTSRRPGGQSDKKDKDNNYYEDVWMSKKQADDTWGTPVNLGNSINSESHDACIGISPDGKELFMYKTGNAGDIYVSNFKDGAWTKPEPFASINSKHKEPSVTISSNGKTIYFSSDRPGGFGGLDIYKIEMDKNGSWSAPQNMGSSVNTEFDEDSPFIAPDGKTLYFSSNGHNSMGGYDIFSIEFNPKTKSWGSPKNLGYPINSADDDIYFVTTGNQKTAYYASARKDGFGEKDIYMIQIDTAYITEPLMAIGIGATVPAHVLEAAHKRSALYNLTHPHAHGGHHHKEHPHKDSVLYAGKVVEQETQKPVEATIVVKKIHHHNEKPKEYRTDKEGNFAVALAIGHDYAIDIEKPGYIFYSDNVDLTKVTKASDYKTLSFKEVALKNPKKGDKFVLKNIFYKPGNASLEADSFEEIKLLAKFLKENPNVKIEIAGHTDNTGSNATNMELSKARAFAVYKVLVKWGIDANRLKYIGYGSDKPVASNATPEGRQQNRRTEFEIID